jgi:hypothetical protein
MSDRPIQAMQTPTISNNYNAVFHHTDGDVWHAGRQKSGFHRSSVQPSGLWWVAYWWSVSTALKNITAMPSSMSAWIANNVCMGAEASKLHLYLHLHTIQHS